MGKEVCNNMNIGNKSFTERLEFVCNKYANNIAITYLRNDNIKETFSFCDIHARIKDAKEQFKQMGLCAGDRVALISPHTPFAIMAGFALAYSNITTVIIDATLPIDEITKLFEFADVRAVFTTSTIYNKLRGNYFEKVPVFDLSDESSEYKLFSDSSKLALRPITSDPDLDVISILFSSGTTAEKKGVMITYTAVEKARPMYHEISNSTDNASLLYALPFNHVAGFFIGFQFFLSGSSMGMIEDIDATKISAAFHSYQPEFFALVPKFYEIVENKIRQTIKEKGVGIEWLFRVLFSVSHFSYKYLGINIGKHLFKGIRDRAFGKKIVGLGTGGSICKASTTSFFLDLGISTWANFYALTETYVPAVATGAFDRYPAGTVGRIDRFEGINIKIHGPNENGVGEIRIKSIMAMKGYFRDPELTTAAFDEDGYFKTGDLGYIDKKKYLYVTGRAKEAIHLHTGKKVSPSDVDSLYSDKYPDIIIASCGVPTDDGIYDEIHLFIERGKLTVDEWQDIKKIISKFSIKESTLYQISDVHFIDKLPTTSIGKVQRFKLREIAIAERES